MLVLGIETSCDETAVAILNDRRIVADYIASQDQLHAPFGGIVPELAARRHMEILAPMAESARVAAGIAWRDLDGIAVTYGPGLIGSLLVGLSFAKGLALANQLPLIGVNHLEGHLLVAQLQSACPPPGEARATLQSPFLGLVVSGGHTSLYLVRGIGNYELLGATRDDAAGEAYDKAAKMLGLPYPGGPHLDRLAATGDASRARFSRPNMKRRGSPFEIGAYDFSFSGLKTALRASLESDNPPAMADLAAGFQHRVIEEITVRLLAAARATGCSDIVVSGGVAANQGLRARLAELAATNQLTMHIPSFRHCTDNAVMIAWAGLQRLQRGERHDWSLNAVAVEELGFPPPIASTAAV